MGWILNAIELGGVEYSHDGACSGGSILLHEQVSVLIPVDEELGVGVLGFAAVRSQCRLMKIGMSEKARKRWVLIFALA